MEEKKFKSGVRKRFFCAIAIVLVISVAIFCTTPAFAKYISIISDQLAVKSGKFYFSSSFITASPDVYLYGGAEHEFEIDVSNFEDELRINANNIDYTITASSSNAYALTAITNVSASPNISNFTGGTLTGGVSSTDTLLLTFPVGYDDGTIVTIEIESSNPYAKTLTLIVHLYIGEGPTYYVEDSINSTYCTLYILAPHAIAEGVINVSFDNTKMLVDNSDLDILSTNADGNGVINLFSIVELEENSAIAIVFIKVDRLQNFTLASTDISDIMYINLTTISGS